MKKTKQIFYVLPEYFLIVLIVLLAYTPPFLFNLFVLVLAIIPILQIIYKNRTAGLLIGIIFMLINLYMLGALISEFNEFPEFNDRAQQLLFVGLSFWIINMIISVSMIYKYSKNEIVQSPSLNLNQASH